MNGEIQTLLGDLNSLLSELQTAIGDQGEAPMEEEVTTMGMDENYEEIDEEEKITARKGLEQTDSDSSTANDDAEERVKEPLPEESADNVDEVAKAILNLLSKKPVKKSINKSVKKVSKSDVILSKLVNITNRMVEKQSEQEKALVNILQGLGLADHVEKQYQIDEEKKVNKGFNNTNDVKATLDYLAKALSAKEEPKQDFGNSQADTVHKTLSKENVLRALIKPSSIK